MHSRVDPAATLREEDLPRVRCDGPRLRPEDVLGLVLGVELEQQGGQVSVLAKVEQVFHVQSVDTDGRVGFDNLSADEQRLASLSGP